MNGLSRSSEGAGGRSPSATDRGPPEYTLLNASLWLLHGLYHRTSSCIYESGVLSVTHTCSVQSILLGSVGGLVLPASSSGWDMPTGIWAPANQWLSFAVDRIHHNRGTFREWALSTCISVTETVVKVANQRGQILWLLMPRALSPSQRNKKTTTAFVKWAKEHLYH